MVLPLIIGVGVTIIALTARSGLQAWARYKTLTPLNIARLNNVVIDASRWEARFHRDPRFVSNRLNKQLKADLEQKYYGGFLPKMSEDEALLILNIKPHEIRYLDEKMVQKKHRQALLRNHPDKDGSPYLSVKINEAKEVIMKSMLINK